MHAVTARGSFQWPGQVHVGKGQWTLDVGRKALKAPCVGLWPTHLGSLLGQINICWRVSKIQRRPLMHIGVRHLQSERKQPTKYHSVLTFAIARSMSRLSWRWMSLVLGIGLRDRVIDAEARCERPRRRSYAAPSRVLWIETASGKKVILGSLVAPKSPFVAPVLAPDHFRMFLSSVYHTRRSYAATSRKRVLWIETASGPSTQPRAGKSD